MSKNCIELAKMFFTNQVKQKYGNYHFQMSGTIFSLGYGPRYHCNKHGLSIDCFSDSEYTFLCSD